MENKSGNKKVAFYKDPSVKLIPMDRWDAPKYHENLIRVALADAISQVEYAEIEVSSPINVSNGDFSTNVAFRIAAIEKISPKEIAKNLVSKLQENEKLNEFVEKMEVAGAGYINFFLKKEALIERSTGIGDVKPADILSGKRIMFEYGHPNPFKMIHIGHLRNFILGESLIRIFEYLGAEIIRTNYQGDVGMHVAKSIWGMKHLFNERGIGIEEIEKLDSKARVKFIGEAYVVGSKNFEEDDQAKEEIKAINFAVYTVVQNKLMDKNSWQPRKKYSEYLDEEIDLAEIENLWTKGKEWCLEDFQKFYNRLGVRFEREYMESETLYFADLLIKEALEKEFLVESQGAIIFPGDKYGLDTRVFVNSLGLLTYEGKELGLAKMEFSDFGEIDLCLHNVAVEQISFFKITFKVESLLDKDKYEGRQFHNAYEFVGLKSGKMSSRKGSVVLAEDIIDEAKESLKPFLEERDMPESEKSEVLEKTALGAIKYSFLNISAGKYLAFDMDASVNLEGNSGPYIMYSVARTNRLIEKADFDYSDAELQELKEESEINLLKVLGGFDSAVIESAKNLSPNQLTNYLYELAQAFNSFYKQHPILNEKSASIRDARTLLTSMVRDKLSLGLSLLGIDTVDRM